MVDRVIKIEVIPRPEDLDEDKQILIG